MSRINSKGEPVTTAADLQPWIDKETCNIRLLQQQKVEAYQKIEEIEEKLQRSHARLFRLRRQQSSQR